MTTDSTPTPAEPLKTVTRETVQQAKALIERITPVPGEARAVYRCVECKALFGRRFIPGGIGRGLSVEKCICQLTQSNFATEEIMRSEP